MLVVGRKKQYLTCTNGGHQLVLVVFFLSYLARIFTEVHSLIYTGMVVTVVVVMVLCVFLCV